ncbi:hypothetical protein MAPG_10539 [Magnaporthiopsis poae ATCC 64411]|uniref:Uncharacterized protein n=1 Tax=Magnaporthiopsis poae (strain ATCC 64411 / 73-15) TaxID=644358 RepID=A0A0C4ECV3_MAGP6|nr:hypothetical protein MAPG_10539 [Magnaporthiopsis poae ATCC 64411]
MAALVATTLPAFPALDRALSVHDFQESRVLTMRPSLTSPRRTSKKLAALFTRHGAEKAFGIHLVHGHFQIPEGTVMVGTNFQNPDMRWTKTTDLDKLDTSSIHGHIFVLTKNGFRAYEFQDGPLLDLSHVGRDFLADFSRYLADNNLADVIGLQVLGDEPCNSHGMSELILDQGTIMLDTSLVKNCEPTRVTGWSFGSSNGSLPGLHGQRTARCSMQASPCPSWRMWRTSRLPLLRQFS